ncbi:MAG: hypothetical protein ACJ0KD_06760 [Dehalococcoidia bacterium]
MQKKYEISRTIQDEYALRSQERAKVAVESGYFKDQISPIEVRKGRDTFTFETDEHPRATSIDKLANLRPVFRENGSVTAGNSSGINDGAAAVVLTTATQAQNTRINSAYAHGGTCGVRRLTLQLWGKVLSQLSKM